MPEPISRESRPNPDPSTLTTDSMLREAGHLKELVEALLEGLSAKLGVRLEGMDKALVLLQARADKVPSETDIAVGNLRSLHDEKFASIAIQFKERDTRTEQASKDSKVALDAALSAQKESVDKQNISNSLAIAKSEAGFTKQIDQTGLTVQAIRVGVDEKVGDIKDRLITIEGRTRDMGDINDIRARITAIESRTNGAKEVIKDTRDNMSVIIAVVAVAIALGVAFFKP